ncbi:MAG: thioesterase family protein [Mycobacteriaceae bacterium]
MTAELPTADPFVSAMSLVDLGRGRFGAHLEHIWTIGPKVHGGTMLALCASAARAALADGDPLIQPISVSASYLSAPDPGDMMLSTHIRKRGRRLSLVDIELSQNDRIAVHAVVSLAAPDLHTAPVFSSRDALLDMPTEPPAGLMNKDHPMASVVHVAQGCHMHLDETSASFLTGATGEPRIRMWVKPQLADPDALFALMVGDICPPITMNLGRYGWAPTIQLTTYLRALPAPGWLRVMASSTEVGQTWFEEDHLVIDSTGTVVVQSRQLAMVPAAIT